MTPQEMADWLDQVSRWSDIGKSDQDPHKSSCDNSTDADVFRAIAGWIRQQPTDAQKMEALKLARSAGYRGCARVPAVALRLLGLPTGDDTP